MRIICSGIHQVKKATKLQEIIAKLQQHFPQNLRSPILLDAFTLEAYTQFCIFSRGGGKEIGEVARN